MSDGNASMPEPPPPCVLFEDEHLLVIDKPAGMNTHAPDPFAGEGIHEWFKHREPRWASLAIVHRLDKGTSGVMVFAKTSDANRALTAQFTDHKIRKTYLLLTDRPVPNPACRIRSCIVRAGSKYRSFPEDYNDAHAETHFKIQTPPPGSSMPVIADSTSDQAPILTWVQAKPVTGRTHQIRVHAAELGFPILGDTLYGGTRHPRVCLHAAQLELDHPVSGRGLCFTAPIDFFAEAGLLLRAALIDPAWSTAWRLIHGASDGWPHGYVDKLGDHWLAQSDRPLSPAQRLRLENLRLPAMTGHRDASTPRGQARQDGIEDGKPPRTGTPYLSLHHKTLRQDVRHTAPEDASPQCWRGNPPGPNFTVTENGLHYELSFREGYSVGLFLDQRDNRRRLLVNHVAAGFPLFPRAPADCNVLNAFAYTCAFSVCAARAGATTTSLDLSRKYLDWGKRNFLLNGLNPDRHDFIYGDVFNWLPRLARKGRRFDVILLDPPTFSKSKQSGVFRADKDYAKLIREALPMLNPGGTLLASANTAKLESKTFLGMCHAAISRSGRQAAKIHYAPQPPDFPVSREEPAYLKTVWMKVV